VLTLCLLFLSVVSRSPIIEKAAIIKSTIITSDSKYLNLWRGAGLAAGVIKVKVIVKSLLHGGVFTLKEHLHLFGLFRAVNGWLRPLLHPTTHHVNISYLLV
jgi:hypothetical protein